MLARLPFVRRLLVRSDRWRDAPEFAVALTALAAVCAAGAHGLWALVRLALGPALPFPVPPLDPPLGAVWGVGGAVVAVVVLRTGPWRHGPRGRPDDRDGLDGLGSA